MNNYSLESYIFNKRFAWKVARWLAFLVVLLALLDIVFVIVYPHSRLFFRFQFDVDNEGNFTTWVNGNLDLFVCLVAWLIAWLIHRRPTGKRNRFDILGWFFVGCVFLYLSADDVGQIHEHTFAPLERLADSISAHVTLPNWLHWNLWIPLLGALGIGVVWIMIIFFRRNVWHVPVVRTLVVLGLVLMLSNPITEVAETYVTEPKDASVSLPTVDELFVSDHTAWVEFKLLTLIQEVTEMGAMIAFLTGFLLFGEWLLLNDEGLPQKELDEGNV